MARKTVYVPDELLEELAGAGEIEPNLSRAFQEFLMRKAEKAKLSRAARVKTEDSEVFDRWRPSRIREIAKGASSWTTVDYLAGQGGGTAHAVRGLLEDLGVRVNMFGVGTAQHAIEVLNGQESTAPYLIVAMDADAKGFDLPSLAKELEETQAFHKRLTPEDLHQTVDLPGRTVISFGGGTGTSKFAGAFLDNGCVAYIAPGDSKRFPFRYACTFAIAFIFYELVQGRSIEEAVDRLRIHDEELAMWKLFT